MPIAAPMTIAARLYGNPAVVTCGPKIVASTAIAMPTMPYRLPRRDVSWLERPPKHRMKAIVAARYATVARERLTIIGCPSFAEHLEHALRHGEAAEHVDGGKADRHDRQPADPFVGAREI